MTEIKVEMTSSFSSISSKVSIDIECMYVVYEQGHRFILEN